MKIKENYKNSIRSLIALEFSGEIICIFNKYCIFSFAIPLKNCINREKLSEKNPQDDYQ
jgi:hypothetical protein